jgi:hypothetical protein
MSHPMQSQRRLLAATSGLVAIALGLPSCTSSGGKAGQPSVTTAPSSLSSTAAASPSVLQATGAASTSSPSVATSIPIPSTTRTVSAGPQAQSRAGSLGPIPDQLQSLEAGAEDVIDLVAEDGWGAVAREVDTMRSTWTGFRTEVEKVDASHAVRIDTALDALKSAAAREDAQATSQAANDISGPVIELFGHYDLPRPIQIGRLDVIGRQIRLDGDRNDDTAAAAQLAAARDQWAAVKADVIAHNGAAAALKTDAVLAAVERSLANRDRAALEAAATELLEAVDSMEGLYA